MSGPVGSKNIKNSETKLFEKKKKMYKYGIDIHAQFEAIWLLYYV